MQTNKFLRRLVGSVIVLFLSGIAPLVAQVKFSRGIKQNVFVEKGQFITGLSASFSQSNQNNYQFLIVEGISGSTYSMKISPLVCYMFKDNMGVGGRVAYNRSRTKIDKAQFIIDSETDYTFENAYDISHSFSAMAIFRNYISLGSSKRFGLLAEAQLEFGCGESKLTSGNGEDFTGTYKRNYSIELNISPGLVVFLNNHSALEVNVGILGFGYNFSKMTTDQIHESNFKSKRAIFKTNILAITFGVSFYL